MMTMPLDMNGNDLKQQLYWQRVDQLQLDEAADKRAKDVLEKIVALSASNRQKATTIKSDPDLTESGKRPKLAALVVASDKALADATGGLVAELEQKILSASTAIQNAQKFEPNVVDTLRAIEVRAACQNIDALALQTKITMMAADGSDDFSVQSVLAAPSIAPLLTDDTAKKVRQIMTARILPDQSSELVDARATLSALQNSITTARDSFAIPDERNTLGVPDAIACAALGLGAKLSIPAADAPGA